MPRVMFKEKITFVCEWINSLGDNSSLIRVLSRVLRLRFWIIFNVHLLLFSFSYILSFIVLNEKILEEVDENLLWHTLIPLVVIRLTVFWYHDLYQGLWRYTSFKDLLNIIRAALISTGIFITIGIIWKPLRVPESLYALDLILCIMIVGGIRFLVRNFRERFVPGYTHKEKDNVLVVGPIENIHPLVKDLISDPYSRYNPLAIVDPAREERSGLTRVIDVPVLSIKHILRQKNRFQNLASIVLCWPGASRKQLDNVVDAFQFLQVPFKTIPSIEEILSDRIKISDIRDVEIEDLLERPPVRIEMDRIREHLHGKIVLVTGGGGSIGSELCRQVAGFGPELLVVIERSENNLYDLQLELKKNFPEVPLYAPISTINNYMALFALMTDMKVDTVFHAAAYKHVPLMESALVECAHNNILGTYNLAQASLDAGVKRFVMISTDKAVNPTNVMGVNKRIAEMVVQSYNGYNQTKFMTVRFGNVLGSAGSVTPLFRKQIAEGGPVTVTHPEIERFFMTIPEAVQLILQAGSMGDGGEIFVLEMGKPVKVLHLAEKLITLSGKLPYQDIEIIFTGLRPGEKMYEELLNHGEKLITTTHNQIMAARSQPFDVDFIKTQIEEIQRLVRYRDDKALREKFKELVPEYHTPVEVFSKEMNSPDLTIMQKNIAV